MLWLGFCFSVPSPACPRLSLATIQVIGFPSCDCALGVAATSVHNWLMRPAQPIHQR